MQDVWVLYSFHTVDSSHILRLGLYSDVRYDREYKNCIGCKCESFVKMRKNTKEKNVQLCEGYDMNEEILVNYTEKGKQIFILDL